MAAAVAASAFLLAAAVLPRHLAAAILPRHLAAMMPVQDVESPCVITATHGAHPSEPLLDGEVTITTSLRASCPSSVRRLHVVLLVDASEHMVDRGRDWLAVLLSDLEDAVRALPKDDFAHARVGVVSFSEGIAQSEARLTDDVDELVIGLHNITIRPGDRPLGGLSEGTRKTRRMFQNGRDSAGDVPVREIVVLASRGFETAQCEAVRASTNEVKAAGIVLVTACGGGACERRCLAEAASAPDLAFASSSGWGYLGVGLPQLIGSTGPFHPVSEIDIVDRLSDQLLYVGGGDPNAGVGNRLEWSFRPWPAEGVTRSYRARVLGTGRFPVSDEAWATLTYNPALRPAVISQTIQLPDAWLDVLVPTATSAPTATRATVPTPSRTPDRTPNLTPDPSPDLTPDGTADLTPEHTPTRSGTPEPTPSAYPPASQTPWTGRGRVAYLPSLLAGGCAGGPWPADVVLVVDVSGSMQGTDVGAMRSRWHAAREVALDLALYHLPPRDRVAVVPFAGDAEVRAHLVDRRDVAVAALEALPRWNGSRMDLALETARLELASVASGRERMSSIVILTDGDLNQTEVPELLAAARGVRSSGTDVFVIVLGETTIPAVLMEVAGGPGHVFTSSSTRVLALAEAVAPHLHCR